MKKEREGRLGLPALISPGTSADDATLNTAEALLDGGGDAESDFDLIWADLDATVAAAGAVAQAAVDAAVADRKVKATAQAAQFAADKAARLATPPPVLITGATYPVRDQLKALGGRWDALARGWRVPAARAAEARALVAPQQVEKAAASRTHRMVECGYGHGMRLDNDDLCSLCRHDCRSGA